ncbi:MAG TPA: CocE/NonD family hydrolase [Acidimicrobiales bacterium]|nr:CocE/NonD family hydrolase [Acidimicrobiales bacterium]
MRIARRSDTRRARPRPFRSPGSRPRGFRHSASGMVLAAVTVAVTTVAVTAVAVPAGAVTTGGGAAGGGAAGAGAPTGNRPASGWAPQPAAYGEGSSLNQPVTAADGTMLRADVYYPTDPATGAAAPGPFPVLLQQTPYGKQNIAGGAAASLANTDVPYFVDRGYIVVVADVRGTGSSGGTWGLFTPVQGTDGATLVDWSATLPHSDGKVGLFGESYMGIDQFLTVADLPATSPVKAMFPIIAGNDLYRDTVTQGGLVDLEFSAFYLSLVAGLNAANPVGTPLQDLGDGTTSAGAGTASAVVSEELQHDAGALSYDAPTLATVETGGPEAYDGPYWASRSPVDLLRDVVADHIPAFLVGGWHDLFQRGELLNYTGLQNLAAGRPVLAPMTPHQRATPRYQLLMGPWTHLTTGAGVDLAQVQLEWFDTWLLGQRTPLATTADPLHLNLLGTDQWMNAAAWPLPQAAATQLYFGAGPSGSAGASTNDGTLSTARPTATTGAAGATGADPVVFTGASSACDLQTDQWSAGLLAAASDQAGVADPCTTDDVTLGAGPGSLTYTSAPMATTEVVGGPIDATVYATSTTADTELVATVEAVSPTGDSVPLTSGALLGSFRQERPDGTWTGTDGQPLLPYHPYTQASAQPVVPGAVTRYDIEVFPTFAQVPAGWRIRVTLSTSDTPNLAPTLAQLPHLVGGVYQVQRTAAAASFVNLPLAPQRAFATPCTAVCAG